MSGEDPWGQRAYQPYCLASRKSITHALPHCMPRWEYNVGLAIDMVAIVLCVTSVGHLRRYVNVVFKSAVPPKAWTPHYQYKDISLWTPTGGPHLGVSVSIWTLALELLRKYVRETKHCKLWGPLMHNKQGKRSKFSMHLLPGLEA